MLSKGLTEKFYLLDLCYFFIIHTILGKYSGTLSEKTYASSHVKISLDLKTRIELKFS